MESSEVIQNIYEIYERFQIPPWLQRHMITSAAVAELICDNWTGPEINKNEIISRNLIHDLGNIVKMRLDSELDIKLAKSSGDTKGIAYWKKVKGNIIKKYGSDDSLVTKQMTKEIPVTSKLFELLCTAEFSFNKVTKYGTWEQKICAYSDQRIGPFGVLSLKERYAEHKERYKGTKDYESATRDANFKAGLEIEKQILTHLKISAEDINDKAIQPYLKRFLKH